MLERSALERLQFPVAGAEVPELSAFLMGVPVADVPDAALVGLVQGWDQVIRAAQAHQARAVAELDVRHPVHPSPVPDELACALACTRRAAEMLMVRATLAVGHPAVHDAWLAGFVDARKVDVLLAEALVADPSDRDQVLLDGLTAAPTMTAPQLTRHLRTAVLAADPDAAEDRRIAARADRVVSLTAGVDGMAWLSAYLPAPDAVMAYTVIDALAGSARPGADRRTVDQRRADAFSDLFTQILHDHATFDGTPLPRRHGQTVSVGVTVAASTLLGLDEQPAHLASYGPITAPMARELAQDGTWRRLLTDPSTGLVSEVGTVGYRPGADLTRTVIARDVTCTFPGCRQPAARCDLDHITPYDHSRPGDTQTRVENLHALCRHHHRAKTMKLWNVTRHPDTGVTTWTSATGYTYLRYPIAYLARPREPGDPAPPAEDPPPF